ncbi:hypothetical protein [Paenibacillus agricola]|uniref:Uncharacterized protein n=1 Tax=Paenibacillus agricola TaxID=2716264 RepID=A0ABX0JLV1_9BACL|nr:hypothetical protein [Paenibacillus agricola]NHN35040.1 hypothetical protein [Paenibacillus agricola]
MQQVQKNILMDVSLEMYANQLNMSSSKLSKAFYIRGHWEDRLKAIEADISAMERVLAGTTAQASSQQVSATSAYPASSSRSLPPYKHNQPNYFTKGSDLELAIALLGTGGGTGDGAEDGEWQVSLRYRHANQDELYKAVEMTRRGEHFSAIIPGAYTHSLYPIVYFFVIEEPSGKSLMVPGFDENLSNQPYYILRERT